MSLRKPLFYNTQGFGLLERSGSRADYVCRTNIQTRFSPPECASHKPQEAGLPTHPVAAGVKVTGSCQPIDWQEVNSLYI